MKQDYIPLAEFVENLPMGDKFPYEVRISFDPLIERVESFSKKSAMSDLVYQEVMKKFKHLESLATSSNQDKEYSADLEHLLAYYFPLFSQQGILGFVGTPFGQNFIYQTPALKQLFTSEEYEIRLNNCEDMSPSFFPILHAARLILATCYHRKVDLDFSETFTLRHRETGLEKHYRSTVYLDSIKIVEKEPLKPISDEILQHLLNNYSDSDQWLEHFPPENFAFEGMSFVLFEDVTEMEILSRLRERISDLEDLTDLTTLVRFTEQQIRSFLNSEHIVSGIVPAMMTDWNEKMASMSILSRLQSTELLEQHPILTKGSVYEKVFRTQEPVICRDLNEEPVTVVERVLLRKGVTSLIVVPVIDKRGEVLAIIELGSNSQAPLSAFTLFRIREILSLIKIGLNRFQREVENSISIFMQKEFTSIHPSVDWKFRQVARMALFQKKEHIDMDISFPDVHPLFGQFDIVGSSRARSEAIQADMNKNLKLLTNTLEECQRQMEFPLLGMIASEAERWQRKIAASFFSNDETKVNSFLMQEVHPLLQQMSREHPDTVGTTIQHYFQQIDPQVGIIYEKRKAFEQTVSQINQTVARYIEEEELTLQQTLPHYFELYKTDGIEYNMYLGQSLLRGQKFSESYVKNFRLWQLISMCNIVRLLEEDNDQLPMPLSTAQLIFVYSNTLNIQFRNDEKKFDVEGVYNVRYEIIKKRIDKAYVAGKNERLTLAGHIAIAYLDEKDKAQYLQFIDYLKQADYIEPKVEELSLEKVQGVEGIQALRIKVNTHKTATESGKSKRMLSNEVTV